MNIYVSNLNFRTTEEDLRNLFSRYGNVTSAKIIKDKETSRSRGFGFVEMSSDADGKEAIEALNNKEVAGRPMSVSEARAKDRDDRRSSGYNRGSNGGRRW